MEHALKNRLIKTMFLSLIPCKKQLFLTGTKCEKIEMQDVKEKLSNFFAQAHAPGA